MKRKKLVAIAAVGALTLGVAFAGGAASARVHKSVRSVRGVTDTSITVAGLGQAAYFADSKTGAQARFDEENAKGGVFGRKLSIKEFADDKSDPNLGLSEAKRLVQQDGVFAVLPLITPSLSPATATFLAQQHVPFLGWAIAQAWCKNPYAFGITGCIVPPTTVPTTGTTWGALIDKYFKAQGDPKGGKGKTAADITEDNATGKEGRLVTDAYIKKGGHMKVVYSKGSLPAPPAVVGDYSPYVNDIMTSNHGKPPDAVFMTVSFANTGGLAKGLIAAGFKGVITDAVGYYPGLEAANKAQSVFVQWDIPEDVGNPTTQGIVAAIKKSAGDKVAISQFLLAGYFSADYFIKVLRKVGKNLTPEAFAKVAAHFTYQIKGVIGPTKYPAALTQGAPCGLLVQSDGTKYNIVVPYGCYSNFNFKTGKKLKY